MKEYIVLISEYSHEVKSTLDNACSGKIKEINYKSKNKLNTAGGALAKSTSKPKDMHKEENAKFIASLNNRQLELKNIYEKIRNSKSSDELVKMVQNGQIKPSDRNGLGQCPLLFAGDCSFGISTCQALLDLGCDLNSADSNGDTLLHQAVALEDTDLEKWLVETKGMSKEIKNNDGETPYD